MQLLIINTKYMTNGKVSCNRILKLFYDYNLYIKIMEPEDDMENNCFTRFVFWLLLLLRTCHFSNNF